MTEDQVRDLIESMSAGWGGIRIKIDYRQPEHHDFAGTLLLRTTVMSSVTGEPIIISSRQALREAMYMDEETVIQMVRHSLENLIMHEMDEWFKVRGKPVRDPHLLRPTR